ncbi:hypothetical protein CLF_104396 [Clonorchis sinensis]|uniref:Endonuclease/exonuclease/phosphatase domain-containing protein n=1 Tax=Clonorchis sinensis TaxID=79923 RepID=G7YBK7_CLOSI|nr:hypothetical protein CLF_104396 [Clonorchis sinensis]
MEQAIKNRTNSPIPNHTVKCKCSSLIDVLAAKLELFSKALKDANTKNAATWTKVDKQLSSLNEYLALSTPCPLAAKKVIRLSDAAIKSATAFLVDRRKILERTVSIQKANPTTSRLSEDRPLDARKLGHSSSGEQVRKRLLDGASSADPKLKAKPIVVLAPCAPQSTRQTTATPGSSFHTTTADPSNSIGSDALEEASLTLTEHPKYVELSALLSVAYVKGATVYSTPKSQPSWIGSDERSQVAKPTGKPTTCADVDIGECRENRTTTEAVKLPISSSTLSKVASLIVDTDVAQDHDSQSLKRDQGGPDSPSYTQLATLIAGGSDVHTSAKERRLQQNRSYTIRQIRKLLAGFKVQSSAKTSLMGAPPKELLGAATQRSNPYRETFPIKPGQHAQATKRTQDFPLSNSKSGRPKGVIERTTSNKPAQTGLSQEKTANEKRPTKPPIKGADKYASEVPSEPSTQKRDTELQCVGPSGLCAAALTEVFQQCSWTQHAIAPTRYRAGQQPSLLDLVITNERHFVDQMIINALRGHSNHCVLTFDFICYWARNPEPQTWIRNFCRADFSGMRIFLDQVKLGPASVEDLYRNIVQKVHEADAMFVPKKPARSRRSRKLPKRIRRLLEKRSSCHGTAYSSSDRGTLDDRYGAVHKPKHVMRQNQRCTQIEAYRLLYVPKVSKSASVYDEEGPSLAIAISDENLVDMEHADVLIFKEEEMVQLFLNVLTKVIPSFEILSSKSGFLKLRTGLTTHYVCTDTTNKEKHDFSKFKLQKRVFKSVAPITRFTSKNAKTDGCALRLCRSQRFLQRTQITQVGNKQLPPLSLTSGVIRVNVLGPNMFILYINDASRFVLTTFASETAFSNGFEMAHFFAALACEAAAAPLNTSSVNLVPMHLRV